MSDNFEVEDGNFTIIGNEALKVLSVGAVGTLVHLLSKPPTWRYSIDRLARNDLRTGLDRARRYITELQEAGYVTRWRGDHENGQGQKIIRTKAWRRPLHPVPPIENGLTPWMKDGWSPSDGFPVSGESELRNLQASETPSPGEWGGHSKTDTRKTELVREQEESQTSSSSLLRTPSRSRTQKKSRPAPKAEAEPTDPAAAVHRLLDGSGSDEEDDADAKPRPKRKKVERDAPPDSPQGLTDYYVAMVKPRCRVPVSAKDKIVLRTHMAQLLTDRWLGVTPDVIRIMVSLYTMDQDSMTWDNPHTAFCSYAVAAKWSGIALSKSGRPVSYSERDGY